MPAATSGRGFNVKLTQRELEGTMPEITKDSAEQSGQGPVENSQAPAVHGSAARLGGPWSAPRPDGVPISA